MTVSVLGSGPGPGPGPGEKEEGGRYEPGSNHDTLLISFSSLPPFRFSDIEIDILDLVTETSSGNSSGDALSDDVEMVPVDKEHEAVINPGALTGNEGIENPPVVRSAGHDNDDDVLFFLNDGEDSENDRDIYRICDSILQPNNVQLTKESLIAITREILEAESKGAPAGCGTGAVAASHATDAMLIDGGEATTGVQKALAMPGASKKARVLEAAATIGEGAPSGKSQGTSTGAVRADDASGSDRTRKSKLKAFDTKKTAGAPCNTGGTVMDGGSSALRVMDALRRLNDCVASHLVSVGVDNAVANTIAHDKAFPSHASATVVEYAFEVRLRLPRAHLPPAKRDMSPSVFAFLAHIRDFQKQLTYVYCLSATRTHTHTLRNSDCEHQQPTQQRAPEGASSTRRCIQRRTCRGVESRELSVSRVAEAGESGRRAPR